MLQRPLLVGSESDAHLRVVAKRLRELHVAPVIFDADSLSEISYSFSPDLLMVGEIKIPNESRAWLRRIAPSQWTTGNLVGSVADVTLRARVQLIAAIARQGQREWLTNIDALQVAEDRIHQLSVACQLGISTPSTIVSSDPHEIRRALGDDVVLKPIATGAFVNAEGQPRAVYTTPLTANIVASGDFEAAPFIAQQRIKVHRHLRVVTAGTTVMTAKLDADCWPLDWRIDEKAHNSWLPYESPEVEEQAVRLATALRVGFSSQDWLIPATGPPLFIDLNPSGQWMFLPDEVADPITDHIVDFLSH